MDANFEKIMAEGYVFDMTKYLREGWNLFKKGAGSFIGFTVVFFVIIVILAFIPFVNFFLIFVEYALLAGIYVFCRNLLNSKDEFSQFFQGFNSFAQIVLFTLMVILFMAPFLILLFTLVFPFGLFSDLISGNIDPQEFGEEFSLSLEGKLSTIVWVYAALIIAATYISVSYSFTMAIIVDKKVGFWEAMETSRRTIAKHFWGFLAMYLLLGIIVSVGTVITCGLGLLVATPFMYTVIFSAYDDVLCDPAEVNDQNLEQFGKPEEDSMTE